MYVVLIVIAVIVLMLMISTAIFLIYEGAWRHHKSEHVISDDKIDLVILWVDGTDENWLAIKRVEADNYNSKLNKKNAGACRFVNYEELRYLLRSVDMYASWINHIYIVVADGQRPEFVSEDHPRLSFIDHSVILKGHATLPTYNSNVIEAQIFRIPGLSEKFLYSNDDMFFSNPVSPIDLYDGDKPRIFMTGEANTISPTGTYINTYRAAMANAAVLLNERFKTDAQYYIQSHVVKACTKEIYERAYNEFKVEMDAMMVNQFREYNDITFPYLCNIYALHTGLGVFHNLRVREGYRVTLLDSVITTRLQDVLFKMHRPDAKYVCFNDESAHKGKSIEADIHKILTKRYPIVSRYEVIEV